MTVAFIGAHVPLLGLIAYVITMGTESSQDAMWAVLATLIATLVGTGAMLLCLRHLLYPVSLASSALRDYVTERRLPDLPNEYHDEVGTLMADTDRTLNRLDELLDQLEYGDPDTGLPNRRRFHHYLGERLERSREDVLAVAVLSLRGVLRLSAGFGADTAAHARRMAIGRAEAALSYRGGLSGVAENTLAFVLHGKDRHAVVEQLDRVLSALDGILVDGRRVDLDPAAAVTYCEDRSLPPEQITDDALSTLRQMPPGGTRVMSFNEHGRDAIRERYRLEQDLRHAIDEERLSLRYQPVVDVEHGTIIGVEALLRWYHPERGAVSPLVFLPIAEANGLAERLGRWTLETACRQMRRWRIAGCAPKRLAVNLSQRQLNDPALIEHLETVLADCEIPANELEIEVTESAAMEDVESTTKILNGIRALGVATAIDDFGTGYSSMTHLATLPFDRLKIDRSFVRNAGSNSERLAICRALIALAHEMRLAVLAEGTETADEVETLRAQGCREFQGFYFSEAVAPADIAEILERPSVMPVAPPARQRTRRVVEA